MRITGLFLADAVIPIGNANENIESGCYIYICFWKQYFFAYVISNVKYIGELKY